MEASSSQDDGLKWFGEGFDGFPKRLPDDCVEYIIWLVDAKLKTPATIRTQFNDIIKASHTLKRDQLKDYIWQRENFNLKIYPPSLPGRAEEPSDDGISGSNYQRVPRLRGRTNFGDSIADEWLIVYLLLELSKQFPDAWIQVHDTDGEFLLIEAANALPKWLNPDIAEHRVWINHGHLRIIPVDDAASGRKLSLQEALCFIRDQPEKLIISPFIEDEAFFRLQNYPAAISSSLHHAPITIPRRLAYILHQNPAYVSPAVEAFYLRDPVSLKPLTSKDTATLNFPPEDFVTVTGKFTKVGYAQLRSQIFDPPPAWTAVLPRMHDPKSAMGMKLTCGFEMLVSDPQNQNKPAVREIKLLMNDIDSGDETLPSDVDLASWPQVEDDEKWLDIDYNDFEAELSGKRSGKQSNNKGTGFGDPNAQDNLRKMVSRFEDFLNDESAGVDGADEDEDDLDDDESSDSEEDKDTRYDEADFEKAMKEMMGMSPDEIEQSGLLDEARKLAVEDAEQQSEVDEDEEMKKVIELMERELKGHGALDLGDGKKARTTLRSEKSKSKPIFGPERPPHMSNAQGKHRDTESVDEGAGAFDGELSSDDEEFNDVDLGLAKNMLEAFKGQAGTAGPAGNLMRAMGVNMPRDEASDDE